MDRGNLYRAQNALAGPKDGIHGALAFYLLIYSNGLPFTAFFHPIFCVKVVQLRLAPVFFVRLVRLHHAGRNRLL